MSKVPLVQIIRPFKGYKRGVSQAVRRQQDKEDRFRGAFAPENTEGMTQEDIDVIHLRDKRKEARSVDIPPIKDPTRYESCHRDLIKFAETYCSPMFPLPFSKMHLKMFKKIQRAILKGGLYCIAAPRGTGKSTIILAACLWALLYGHRRFMVILCANHTESISRLDSVRTAIETNPLFLEDFPGPCGCVRALEGAWQRSNSQTVHGKRTYIKWGGNKILVFPSIEGCASSGACIATRSMKSAVRGLQHTTPQGTIIRPDIVVLDDPIDSEQSESPVEVDKRERKILKDVLNLGGPGKSISGFMLITCSVDDDLACRFLDHNHHPDWQGEKFKLVLSLPRNKELWDKYSDLRDQCLEDHGDIHLATEFYLANRGAMDEGSEVSWEHRFNQEKGEISAIQHAMNLFYTVGEAAFNAEYQNEPPRLEDTAALVLTSAEVEGSISGLARGVVPDNTLALTSGWDVGKYGIHWTVAATAPGRVVSIIEYGVQPVESPAPRQIDNINIEKHAMEVALLAALRELRSKFLEQPYSRSDGTAIPISFTLVDCGFMDDIVNSFVVESNPSAPKQPLFGSVRGCGSNRNQYHYAIPTAASISRDGNMFWRRDKDGVIRHYANVDAYKQIVQTGLKLQDKSSPGSLALFTPEHRKTHFTFARHITSEMQMEKAPGLFVWVPARGRADNHWLDSTGYCFASISRLEVTFPALSVTSVLVEDANAPKGSGPAVQLRQGLGPRISLADLQRKKMMEKRGY